MEEYVSYNFDGKITNQQPRITNYTSPKCVCEKCGKIIETPKSTEVKIEESSYTLQSYLGTAHFIHETKMGTSVVYCSNYCRKKHNHRFNQGA
jgi:hypothetical protein